MGHASENEGEGINQGNRGKEKEGMKTCTKRDKMKGYKKEER
jgi:hypothetical protein